MSAGSSLPPVNDLPSTDCGFAREPTCNRCIPVNSATCFCKLQMMRTTPSHAPLGPMLAAGLTLRHYAAFAECSTLSDVRAMVTREQPKFDQFGIHVMVSQNSAGELVIGDSHEMAPPLSRSTKK